MASSGTYGLSPEIAELIDEAYERIQVDPATLTGRHVRSALRSLELLMSTLVNYHDVPWGKSTVEYTAVDGEDSFETDDGTIDVLSAVLRRDGYDTPMVRISREDYLLIPDKTTEGRPDRFFVDHQVDKPVVYVWPVFENSTDKVVYTRLRHLENAGTMAATANVRQSWLEAITSGLTARLAEKFQPEALAGKLAMAREALREACNGTRDRSDTVIRPAFGRRRR